MTCINNPVTGEPVNYDPEEEQTEPAKDAARAASAPVIPTTFVLNAPIDVDTAYARLRSAFGFRSDADFNRDLRSDRLMQMDEAYHHETTPGSYYRLSDYDKQVVDGVEHSIILRAEIQRDGDGSAIQMEFMPAGSNLTYDPDAMKEAIQQRVEDVLL
ncbi:hypothetical protein [Billgrantia montanilacus]|uniref:hypothetical protein n=1 Tax=Billgrantia montanilacus TaxID=2282305 RepID=UPI0011C05057|nr:hypothetical protein [Halomonas montanilacus]